MLGLEQLEKLLSQRFSNILSDKISRCPYNPWVYHPNFGNRLIKRVEPWFDTALLPADAVMFRQLIDESTKYLLNDEVRFLNKQHWDWEIRNCWSGANCVSSLQKIEFDPKPGSVSRSTLIDVFKRSWEDIGFVPISSRYTPEMLFSTVMPRAGAASGLLWSDETWWTGKCDRFLYVLQDEAYTKVKRWKDQPLSWDSLETYEQSLNYLEPDDIYLPSFKFEESGYSKPRVIHMGGKIFYLIEQSVFDCGGVVRAGSRFLDLSLHGQYMRSPAIATHEYKSAAIARNADVYVKLDYKKYDQHQSWHLLRALYQAISEFFEIPEWIMTRIFLHNSSAPMVLPKAEYQASKYEEHENFTLVYPKGLARSGSGFFPICNSLANLAIMQEELTKGFDWSARPWGNVLGDNTCWRCRLSSLDALSQLLNQNYGLPVKPEESIIGPAVVMARRWFRENLPPVPLPLSRARKLLLASLDYDGMIRSGSEAVQYIVAVQLRGQLFDWDRLAMCDARFSKVRAVIQNYCPRVSALPQYSDAELLASVPEWAADVKADYQKRLEYS